MQSGQQATAAHANRIKVFIEEALYPFLQQHEVGNQTPLKRNPADEAHYAQEIQAAATDADELTRKKAQEAQKALAQFQAKPTAHRANKFLNLYDEIPQRRPPPPLAPPPTPASAEDDMAEYMDPENQLDISTAPDVPAAEEDMAEYMDPENLDVATPAATDEADPRFEDVSDYYVLPPGTKPPPIPDGDGDDTGLHVLLQPPVSEI